MSALDRARAAFSRQAWTEASTAFDEASDGSGLTAADHEHHAVCTYLIGDDDRSATAWEAAHRTALDAGDPATAARCAFWLAFSLMLRGQMAQAGGWLTRVQRVIDDHEVDCAASGYLMIPDLLGALGGGQPDVARELAVRATEIADRFGDADLRAFSTLGHGQALLVSGDIAGGTSRLDEAMVAVTADEVGPVTAGIVYCAVILECMRTFDLRRASEWTDALGNWCDAQPDLVPYRGQCLIHRSQLQQAGGSWSEATTTAADACRRLTDPPHPAAGLAHYQRAELHRLVGDVGGAQDEFRQAARAGHQPMPGLALLELARGDTATAAAGIDSALEQTTDPLVRPALLAAAVEIHLAAASLTMARAAADELGRLAADSPSVVLGAMAAHAHGAVLLAEGDAARGLAALRSSAASWQTLHMPYEAAKTAVAVSAACSALGDRALAAIELDNAVETFRELGATPDLDRLGPPPDEAPGTEPVLSEREREVLGHVAEGKTNREIAADLMISQHTVSRHLENIFTKLGVTSRAAATAHAYEHDLL